MFLEPTHGIPGENHFMSVSVVICQL
jgi:hypothetical protein